MKLTKAVLKEMILEEMAFEEQSKLQTQDLKKKMIALSRNLAGIQANEMELVDFFLELVELAKTENLNVGEFKRRLGLVQQAAEKI